MKPAEFKRRRHQLMKMMGKNTIAILPSSSELIRNRDAHFPFRQDSDFLYLTGFNEPDAVMVLKPGRKHGEFILFCREKDPEKETWNGLRQGQEGAIENFGADAEPVQRVCRTVLYIDTGAGVVAVGRAWAGRASQGP